MQANPLNSDERQDREDQALANRASAGDREALSALLERHHVWLYNIARRMVYSSTDAEDLAQEAMLRIVTRISQFAGRSSFRTWAYRIALNCFLDAKKRPSEKVIRGFEPMARQLDSIPLRTMTTTDAADPERELLVHETNASCMLAILLCLDREERLVYILCEIFEAPGPVAAEILEVSPAGLRKRLERARANLRAFMDDKCGLVNKANPCRCAKKTLGFIEKGWVDPARMQFVDAHVQGMRLRASLKADELYTVGSGYADYFRAHPRWVPKTDLVAWLRTQLERPDVLSMLGSES